MHDGRFNLHFILSGAITGALTTPLDVMKTRLMIQVDLAPTGHLVFLWITAISNSISLNQKRASEGLGVVSANPVIPGVFLPPFCCLLIVFREPGLLGAHERFICFLTWTCLLPLFGPLVSHGLLNVFPVCADYFGLFSLLDGGLPGERTSYDIFLLCAALLLTCWHPQLCVVCPVSVADRSFSGASPSTHVSSFPSSVSSGPFPFPSLFFCAKFLNFLASFRWFALLCSLSHIV